MSARLATTAVLLLAFGGALALAAQGWEWAWWGLITVALAVGTFEWGRLLGLGRVWRVAYALAVVVFTGFLLVLPESNPYGSFLFMGQIIYFYPYWDFYPYWVVAWLIMLPTGTMFFSRSSCLRNLARNVWLLGGLLVLPKVAWAMVSLSMLQAWSHALLLMLMVAATDTAAFLVGKRFGRRLLAPRISPGKTWVGLGAGLAAAGTVGACLPLLFVFALLSMFADAPRVHWELSVEGLLVGLVIGACVVAGDLAVSALKRFAGVKDSGRLLPGHGGVLDRIDGFLLAAPVFMFLFIVLSAPWPWK